MIKECIGETGGCRFETWKNFVLFLYIFISTTFLLSPLFSFFTKSSGAQFLHFSCQTRQKGLIVIMGYLGERPRSQASVRFEPATFVFTRVVVGATFTRITGKSKDLLLGRHNSPPAKEPVNIWHLLAAIWTLLTETAGKAWGNISCKLCFGSGAEIVPEVVVVELADGHVVCFSHQ